MSASPSKEREDRRRAGRDVVIALAELDVEGSEASSSVLLRDISATGARVLVNRHVEAGDSVELRIAFTVDEEKRNLQMRGKVVRSNMLDAKRIGLWVRTLGIQFEEPFDESDTDLAALREVTAEEVVREGSQRPPED